MFLSLPNIKVHVFTDLDKSDKLPPVYKPVDVVSGTIWIQAEKDIEVARFFVSLEWWTEGKGLSDRGVAASINLFEGKLWGAVREQLPFNLQLPDQPWSYNGELIRIRWDIVVSMETRFSERVICCKEITVAP